MSLEMFFGNDEITVQQTKMKICTRCDMVKPATPEYFYRSKTGRHGFRADCIPCRSENKRMYAQNGGRERKKRRREQAPHRCAFNSLRSKVRRKGEYKFLLGYNGTPEAEAYIEHIKTITHCSDCAKVLIWFPYGQGFRNKDSALFQRIDSDDHYTKKNVRVVCFHCNAQKSSLPIDEWVGLLKVRAEKGIIEEVDPMLIEFLCEEALNAGKG